MRTHSARIVLHGPQPDGSEIRQTLDTLGVVGPVALITAGWQENEADDEALSEVLQRPTVNLALHARAERVFDEDPVWRDASSTRQKTLHRMQEFYRVRLDAIDEADHAISVRHARSSLLDEELACSVEQLRALDAMHLRRIASVHAAFEAAWRTATRPIVARHRDEIDRLVRDTRAVVIAGGHVMSLMNRIRMFDALAAVGNRPIVAYSAGAMVLTDRIVVFHDAPPFGKNLAQVVDTGLGLCPGLVAMPDAARRIDRRAQRGIARFARRMAPAECRTLDPGDRMEFERGRLLVHHGHRLAITGDVVEEAVG
jgi:hypothetical protein